MCGWCDGNGEGEGDVSVRVGREKSTYIHTLDIRSKRVVVTYKIESISHLMTRVGVNVKLSSQI